jgi:thiol-disulfide isomerase/thioredoxin
MCGNPTSAELMKAAQAEAKAEKKNVLVVFHASWCGWCHKLDKFLEDPEMGKLMKASFVIVHMDVLEQGDKKALENEGGVALMESLGGKNAGLPFTAVVDAKGKLLMNSIRKKTGNVGYPATDEEMDHWNQMMKATAPRISAYERGKMIAWMKSHP